MEEADRGYEKVKIERRRELVHLVEAEHEVAAAARQATDEEGTAILDRSPR